MRDDRVVPFLAVLVAAATALLDARYQPTGAVGDAGHGNLRSAYQTRVEPLPRPGTVTAALPPGDGMNVVRSRCVACHAPTMLLQQRLTSQQWRAEIDKMERWGAAISDDDKEQMVTYLVRIGGLDNTRFAPAVVAPIPSEGSSIVKQR